MAIFEQLTARKVLLDDTEPLSCVIENWKTVDGHTEFIIKVKRGPFSDESWTVSKRYNDFVKLHSYLQTSGIPLELPPKKIIGNMDPLFISERQRGLQKYLDTILMNPILVSSLPARSFVDPANYCQPFGEQALQHVSLALRGEVGWEVVGPLADIGWRLRKHYYLLKCKNLPKEEMLGGWTDYGPDKHLSDKDMHSVFKSLSQIQHPYIQHIDLCLSTDIGGLVVRAFNKNGSLRDLICGSKPKLSFLKKYGNPKGHKPLSTDEIALYGRQILEALRFLHEKGFPYGHLHSGNVLIESDRVKLLDIENGILGVPSFYRPYFMQHKKISTMETIDVYCFGHVMYEMVMGTPLHESVIDDMPECPPQIRKVLSSILSSEACKNGLPSIECLLNDPFFRPVQLTLNSNDKAHFKIPTAIKEQLGIVTAKIEERLKGEQKLVRSQKRLVKVQEMMSSEEEKKKHRHKLKERHLSKEHPNVPKNTKDSSSKRTNGGTMDRSDSINSSTATSGNTPSATPPSMSGSTTVPSPPPPPPPPCIDTPIPPPLILNGKEAVIPPITKDRSALLGSIASFDKSGLRKVRK